MLVHVCVRMCWFTCVLVYVCPGLRVCSFTCVLVRVCAGSLVCSCVLVYVCVGSCVCWFTCVFLCAGLRVCWFMCVLVYVCASLRVCWFTCVLVYVCARVFSRELRMVFLDKFIFFINIFSEKKRHSSTQYNPRKIFLTSSFTFVRQSSRTGRQAILRCQRESFIPRPGCQLTAAAIKGTSLFWCMCCRLGQVGRRIETI